MGQKVTIGGDRLGAGHKMQTELHNYGMSTHNLSQIFRSTMGAGILYPSLVLLGERDDHFKIKLDQDIRTQPTVAPLFGSFKLQTDVFMCPIRLYQGLLHNNPTELGRQMNQVKLPKLSLSDYNIEYGKKGWINNSALLKYLGLSGLGRSNQRYIGRYVNAVPALAYYDIFKNYYANKQEEKAYVISAIEELYRTTPTEVKVYVNGTQKNYGTIRDGEVRVRELYQQYVNDRTMSIEIKVDSNITQDFYNNHTRDVVGSVMVSIMSNLTYRTGSVDFWNDQNTNAMSFIPQFENGILTKLVIGLNTGQWQADILTITINDTDPVKIIFNDIIPTGTEYLHLTSFDLSNIDKMRYDILKHQELGESFVINSRDAYLPYATLTKRDHANNAYNIYPMNGLMVKTYQNDIFNNWINSEWIDGENGVSEISKILVEDGAIKIDALQFAKKIYNLYNRIAISGATYYEWQNVVWSESKQTHVESPVYCGGYASEVMFEEIVQQTPTEIDGESQPLGTLGGKGKLIGKKGGYIEVDCEEACFIIAITSITPRISYTQGNEFYMTELDSIDDLHKPELDGIGFQDLLGERMLWSDTLLDNEGNVIERTKIGKVPAWIEYQTAVDKTYGDFADDDKAGYMVLTRKYEAKTNGKIKDVTTYIDPTMYNYAFALTDIDAQNFWLQANYDIEARRRMSAHLIPQA